MRQFANVVVPLLVLGIAAGASVHRARPAEAALSLSPVVSGLDSPVYVAQPNDGSGRLFFVEQPGLIHVLQPGSTTPTVFLDIHALIVSPANGGGNEQGLLSVAFHPLYAANGLFYVYYTRLGDGNFVIAQYSRSLADPNQADPAETPLLVIPRPAGARNHNGGQLQFGPDGCLYAGTGEGGNAGNSQNLGSHLGKLLRLDTTGAACASPAPNPFVNVGGALPEIWALGLRNPWRFSFDRQTGDLSIADVGQDLREELDAQPASSSGGENYCWNRLEGTFLLNPGNPCTTGLPTAPVFEYDHSNSRCSITGGYVYRGSAATLPAGSYLFADFCSGEVFLRQNGFVSLLFDTSFLITSFGEDQDGELYLAVRQGSIQRVTNPGGLQALVGVNRLLSYRTGDILRVGAGARNPGAAVVGDVYLGVILPDGVSVVFITNLAPLTFQTTSLAANPATFARLFSGFAFPAGFDFPMAALFAYTFTGSEPAASTTTPYQAFLAVTTPGALADGQIDAGDVLLLATQPFVFTP